MSNTLALPLLALAVTAAPALWFGYPPAVVLFALAGAALSLARGADTPKPDGVGEEPAGAAERTFFSLLTGFLIGSLTGISAPPALTDATYLMNLFAFGLGYFGSEIVHRFGEVFRRLDLLDKINRIIDRKFGLDTQPPPHTPTQPPPAPPSDEER